MTDTEHGPVTQFEIWVSEQSFRTQWLVSAITVTSMSCMLMGTMFATANYALSWGYPIWIGYAVSPLFCLLMLYKEGRDLIPEGGFRNPVQESDDNGN